MPFRDIVGHRQVLGRLSRALARGVLAPSVIFAGPAGVGKRLAAIAVAQAFNCSQLADGRQAAEEGTPPRAEHPSTFPVDACGACSACRRIARGSFPDVTLLERPADRAGISVEQVRAVTAEVVFRPFEGRRRVVIIDDAAELNADAQDALLKSVEEPPPAAVFILVTAWPDSLRATIRSRCARLRFGALQVGEVTEFLVAHRAIEPRQARTVALMAGGSLGTAIEMADGSFGDEQALALDLLRRASRARDAEGRLDCSRLLQPQDKGPAGRQRDDLAVHLRVLASLIRDAAALASGAPDSALTHPDLAGELRPLAGEFGRARAVRAFQAVERALAALESNASPKIVPDWLAFQL